MISAEAGICLAIAAASLVAFVYPYLIYPQLLAALPRRPLALATDFQVSECRCALLFCAYNEEASLPAKLANLRAIKRRVPHLEILVYSDASNDGTAALLAGAADILTLYQGKRRLGKILGMRYLASQTRAEIIILNDANTLIDPESVPRLLRYFSDPGVGAVSGVLNYVNSEQDDASAVAKVGGLYWRLEERIKHLESLSGSMMGADGALFARRRAGYPTVPPNLSDDLSVSLDVMFGGLRCISASDVHAFENGVSESAEEFQRKRRVSCRSYSTWRHYAGQIAVLGAVDRFKWISHRVLRWWGGPLLLLATVCVLLGASLEGQGLNTLLLLALAMLVVSVLGRRGVRGMAALRELRLAILATTLGVAEASIGRRYTTWKPASSR